MSDVGRFGRSSALEMTPPPFDQHHLARDHHTINRRCDSCVREIDASLIPLARLIQLEPETSSLGFSLWRAQPEPTECYEVWQHVQLPRRISIRRLDLNGQ